MKGMLGPQLLSHGVFSSPSAMGEAALPHPVHPAMMLPSSQAQKQQSRRPRASETVSQKPTCPSSRSPQAFCHSDGTPTNSGPKSPPPPHPVTRETDAQPDPSHPVWRHPRPAHPLRAPGSHGDWLTDQQEDISEEGPTHNWTPHPTPAPSLQPLTPRWYTFPPS